MKWFIKIVVGVFLVIAVGVSTLYATGNGTVVSLVLGFTFGKPGAPFNPDDAAMAPDYSSSIYWAALPDSDDLADMIPAGIADEDVQDSAPVDVFFVHPTGFLKGSNWTFSMDAKTSTEENTRWMMANQASTYNGCCKVYAPRYRQASIFTYFNGEEKLQEQVMDFAYQDVARAFDYFIEHFNQGRPFIIAAHSQGTHHSTRLLKEKIDDTQLAQRLVAAYIIGGVGSLTKNDVSKLSDLTVCRNAHDTRCIVHWDTMSDAAINKDSNITADNVCVNPLNWELDGGLVSKESHQGGVAASGEFHLAFVGSDTSRGVVYQPLAAPLTNYLEAQCKNGVLYVSDQSDTVFNETAATSNYHLLDYPLFHMNIRINAQQRVDAYFTQLVTSKRDND